MKKQYLASVPSLALFLQVVACDRLAYTIVGRFNATQGRGKRGRLGTAEFFRKFSRVFPRLHIRRNRGLPLS